MKNLMYLVLLILSLPAESATLIPLENYVLERPRWQEDISELAYIGTRCDCLYTVIGNWAVENGRAKTKSYGKELLSTSEIFRNVSTSLSVATNMNQTSIEKRFEEIINIYVNTVVDNKRLNNNVFEGYVGKDIEFCKKSLPSYKAINTKIQH